MKYSFVFLITISVLISCQHSLNQRSEANEKWVSDSLSMVNTYPPSQDADRLLDQMMPFIGRKQDSIPFKNRFNSLYQAYYKQHKEERQYKVLYHFVDKDSAEYMMVSRLEPSIKNDKYAATCVQFKRLSNGAIDTATFEELFWTWKMPLNELHPKGAKLFKTVVSHQDLQPYMPGKEDDLYIMFPDANVKYDRRSKTWMPKNQSF